MPSKWYGLKLLDEKTGRVLRCKAGPCSQCDSDDCAVAGRNPAQDSSTGAQNPKERMR